ncbi:MAG: ABC-2 family transporter protein [Chthoniobacterales bacterium]
MTKYLKVFDIALQNTFVYRWNFLLRSLFGLVPLAGTIYIWGAIFHERQAAIGVYDYSSMIFYFMLIIVAESLITPTEDEWQIAADIRDGQLNSFLTKPIDYLVYRLSLFAGYRLLYTVVTLPFILLIFWMLREHITLPAHGITWLYTVISLGLAAILQFLIAYSLAMFAFWILEISTIVFILYSFEYFLSGQLFPLDIMPAWFQRFLDFLPFKYELYFPIAVFLEKMKPALLLQGFLFQIAWVAILYGIARLLWRRGLRKYSAVGG